MGKAIVFGASGQLGQCLQAVSQERNVDEIVFLPKKSANILDFISLQGIFKEHNPDYCINCAAYTAVDKAEVESDLALKINRDGVNNLSKICWEYDTTLIHISTDFVFSGSCAKPLIETDTTAPINVYGASKLEGEWAIQTNLSKYFIIRTSWLYSEYGNNFVKTMLMLGKEKDELSVIWDQLGTPTYATDLANCILSIIENDNNLYGIYHYSNEGVTSWYDFAKAIFDISKTSVRVIPIRSSEYIAKAMRPSFSVLDKSKIKQNFGIEVPYWRESLENCINHLLYERSYFGRRIGKSLIFTDINFSKQLS